MARIPHCLMLAAGAVILLPAIAQADTARSRHAAYRHYHYAAYAYPYRSVGVILHRGCDLALLWNVCRP